MYANRVEITFALDVGQRFAHEEELFRMAKAGELARHLDMNYIEGALLIHCDGVELMGTRHWDLVDQLLVYILDHIDDILRGEPYATMFPDQPLRLGFEPKGKRLLVSVGDNKASVDREAFLRELYAAMCRFFDLMMLVYPSGQYEPYVKKLKKLPARHPFLRSP